MPNSLPYTDTLSKHTNLNRTPSAFYQRTWRSCAFCFKLKQTTLLNGQWSFLLLSSVQPPYSSMEDGAVQPINATQGEQSQNAHSDFPTIPTRVFNSIIRWRLAFKHHTHHSCCAAQEPADLGNGTEAAAGRARTGCLPHVATRTHTSSWLWCSCEAGSRCVVLQCCVRSCKAGHYPNSNSRLTSAGLLATNLDHLQERVLNLLRWPHKVALPLLWGTGLCGSHRHTSQPLHRQTAPESFWRQQ